MPSTATRRERVFILASSADQADLFARQWVAEAPESRGRADARYLHGDASCLGVLIGRDDRVVAVDGWRYHAKAEQIENELRRTLAKTGRSWDDDVERWAP